MKTDNKSSVTINQAKILYILINTDKSDFGEGDFGTDLKTFQPVADAINDLIRRGFITASEWHTESKSGEHKRDRILKCKLTQKGRDELDIIDEKFLNSEGVFDLEKWQ